MRNTTKFKQSDSAENLQIESRAVILGKSFLLRSGNLPNAKAERGAALIVTLSILVLITALVVLFFTTVTTERTESSASSYQSAARQLASTCVELVKSTITQATLGFESDAQGNPIKTKSTSWASQPGLIRTWDEDGAPYRTYRLYSFGNIVVNGAIDLVAEANEINTWKNSPPPGPARSFNALWCDLNAPMPNQNEKNVYPILAPPSDTNSGSVAIDTNSGLPTDNPNTTAQEGIQSFSLSAAPGFTSGAPSAVNNPAPMPVKWIYVLKDGTLVPPSGNASLVNVPAATSDNPIIGRIAYWTDDETSKININTASEGIFWDIPHGINNEEKGLVTPQTLGYSLSVPVADEFQRIAGHPAFTSLSAVLGGWLPRPMLGFGTSGALTYPGGTSFSSNFQPYYNITPRIAGGGTLGGTIPTTSAAPLTLDSDRLYVNSQEILFRPTLSGLEREINNGLTPERVQNLHFLLTANSRSPETTLLEKPRVAMWPIQSNPNLRNAKDLLIAQAATLSNGAHTYYFERATSFVSNDNPGSSQSQTADLQPGSRNERLLNYLNHQLKTKIPAFGAAFSDGKAVGTVEQTTLLAFDTIRSLINTTSRALAPNYTYAPLGPPNTTFDNLMAAVSIGAVVPIRGTLSTGGTQAKGSGRFPIIREVGIIFVATAWKDQTTLNPAAPHTPFPGADGLPDDVPDGLGAYNGVGDPQTSQMQAIVYLLPLHPAPGQPFTAPAVRYKIEGLENLSIEYNSATQNLGFPSGNNAVLLVRPGPGDVSPYPDGGFYAQFFSQQTAYTYLGRTLAPNDGNAPDNNQDNLSTRRFPFYSSLINLNPPANPHRWGLGTSGTYSLLRPNQPVSTFRFNGGTLTIKIYPGTGTAMPADADYIQRYTIELPPTTLPVPQIFRPHFKSSDDIFTDAAISTAENNPLNVKFYTGFKNTPMEGRSFQSRITNNTPWGVSGSLTRMIIWRGDVIRAVQLNPDGPSGADARVIASKREVQAADFAPMADYTNEKIMQVHGITVRNSGGAGNIAMPTHMGFGQNSSTTNPHSWPRANDGTVMRGRASALLNYNDTTGRQVIRPYLPAAMNNVSLTNLSGGQSPGDWNTGTGNIYDGPFFNKADEGYVRSATNITQNIYYPANLGDPGSPAAMVSFSPNRQVSSPVLFGSVPLAPWRTLLFCPNPAAKNNHPGFGGNGPDAPPPFSRLPDHAFLDLFWMPIVEPYAISEPSSTDGKVNLNFQIAPFTYINRATAMHAALKALKIPALRNVQASSYKRENSLDEISANPSWRHDIDVEATLAGMVDRRFNATGQGFRSASEVTTIFLVPRTNNSGVAGPSGATPLQRYNNTANWWDDKILTGDNLRESPYNHLYSRVTTKSNTYTVHYRVQVLKQNAVTRTTPASWAKWEEASDTVLAEHRGSATIERYIDPNDPTVPDFANPANFNRKLSEFYRWRTLQQREFKP
jgi:uncharacterized protein (TIGR02600 family)